MDKHEILIFILFIIHSLYSHKVLYNQTIHIKLFLIYFQLIMKYCSLR